MLRRICKKPFKTKDLNNLLLLSRFAFPIGYRPFVPL